MKLTVEQQGLLTVLTVDGDLDMETVVELREAVLEQLAAGRRHLVLDLDAVSFMDSTGLGVLVAVNKRVRAANGTVRLVCQQKRVLDLLRLTGLHRLFVIASSPRLTHEGPTPPPDRGT